MCFSFALYVAEFDQLNPVHGFRKVSQKLKNTEKSDISQVKDHCSSTPLHRQSHQTPQATLPMIKAFPPTIKALAFWPGNPG